MKYNPEKYQELATAHLKGSKSALLFAGCGLGKTVSTLNAFNELYLEGKVKSMLVVAPLRVANLTWANEVAKWDNLSHLKVVSLRNKEGRAALKLGTAHIYTVNYEQLPQLVTFLTSNGLHVPDIVVYDELTRAKNHNSSRINTWRKFTYRCNIYRWGLTGTPRPNSAMELFAQVRLIDGGRALGESFFRFRQIYFYPTDYMEYNWAVRPGMEQKINDAISPITLVLKSEDYLDIPEVYTEDIEISLPEEARIMYKELEKKLITKLDEENDLIATNRAVLAGKLVQLVGGAMYDNDGNTVIVHSKKLDALGDLLKTIDGPLLIAANYKHEMDRIAARFPEVVRFDMGDSEQTVADWNAGKIKALVAHPASIGHGLNLQSGGNCICWFSQTWSREMYDQMNARLARKGQTKNTVIYRLICEKTIDESIVETLRTRGEEQSALLTTLRNMRTMHELK